MIQKLNLHPVATKTYWSPTCTKTRKETANVAVKNTLRSFRHLPLQHAISPYIAEEEYYGADAQEESIDHLEGADDGLE